MRQQQQKSPADDMFGSCTPKREGPSVFLITIIVLVVMAGLGYVAFQFGLF